MGRIQFELDSGGRTPADHPDTHPAEAHSDNKNRMMVFSALLSAFIAAGAYLIIPIGPVPIVLQNLFVLLSGLLLGSRWGITSVAVYIIAGIVGLPVFYGGTAGLPHIVGPTGGYLIGFLPAAYLVGLVSERTGTRILPQVLAMIGATLVIYVFGVAWLVKSTQMSVYKGLAVGMYPFLIGDALKIAVAVPIARSIKPLIHR